LITTEGQEGNVGHILFLELICGTNFIRIASRTNTQTFPLFIPPKCCLQVGRTISNKRIVWRKFQRLGHITSPLETLTQSHWYLVLWSRQKKIFGEYNAAPSRSLAALTAHIILIKLFTSSPEWICFRKFKFY
jgi:hypothetical protein